MTELIVVDIENANLNETDSLEKRICQLELVNLKSKKKKMQHLVGSLIVRYLILKRCDLKNEDIHFLKNNYGKPYFENFEFNISHSNNLVVGVISGECVGVDIEFIKPRNLDIIKYYFSEKEYLDFKSLNIKNKLKYFYNLWTLKESYLKALGIGFFKPLNSFTVIHQNLKNVFIEKDLNFKFYTPNIHPDYSLSVCCKKNIDNVFCEKYSYKEFSKKIFSEVNL